MKITWVLPQNYDIPVGGYKIVFQYANHLVSIGHNVRIIFLQNPSYEQNSGLYRFGRSIYWYLFHKNPFKKTVTWFPLDAKIEVDWNISARQMKFNKDEKVIATAFWTANAVNRANIPSDNKYYFIQDYEVFSGSEEDVDKTWQLPLKKFSVSTWLSDFGREKFNQSIMVIPNFLDDRDGFCVTNPIDMRQHTIALLNHPSKRKNTKLGLEIIQMVKEKVPDLTVKLFGTEELNAQNDKFIEYFRRPTRKQLRDDIYNQAMIYLLPSEYEGWGLTAMEAMASGDIVISNDNGGVNDFINNGKNGFILDFGKIDVVVDKIVELLKSKDTQLAMAASHITELYSVDKSTELLIQYLNG